MPEYPDLPDVQPIGPDRQLPPPRGERRWIVWTSLILALLVLVAIMAFLHRSNQKAEAARKAQTAARPPVTVAVATAEIGNIGLYQDAIGTVTPVYTASITAQAGGVITAVHYREGQFVRKGDALIDIDSRPYQAQLLQAQGVLEKDTGVLAQASMDLDRYKVAWERNAINKQLLDDQEKAVEQDRGTVKNDRGTVNYNQVQLSYCHIVAPISGRVGLRLVDPGNVVQANGTTVLVVITQVQPITVIFTLPEDSLGQVQSHMKKAHTLPVEAWDRAQGQKLAAGKLETIDNQIDTTTGTVKLRAQFDNRDSVLFPNQFVNTRLLVDTESGVTLIPTAAVQHNGQTAFVYVIASGVANIRNIVTGVSDGGRVAVQGLSAGEVVATSSFEKLQAGSKVTIAGGSGEGNAPQASRQRGNRQQGNSEDAPGGATP